MNGLIGSQIVVVLMNRVLSDGSVSWSYVNGRNYPYKLLIKLNLYTSVQLVVDPPQFPHGLHNLYSGPDLTYPE